MQMRSFQTLSPIHYFFIRHIIIHYRKEDSYPPFIYLQVSHATRLACGGGYSPRGGQFAMYKNKHIAERAQFHRLVSVHVYIPCIDGVEETQHIDMIEMYISG